MIVSSRLLLAALTLSFTILACGEPPAPSAPSGGVTEPTTTSTPTPATATPPTAAPTTTTEPASGGAKEGASCGNGIMGAPKIACAAGLVCDTSNTAPAGPPGAAASARPGVCRKK